MMDISALKNCIGDLAKNVYFCGTNENDHGPSLYVKDKKTHSQLSKLFRQKMKDDPSFKFIKLKTTASLKLNRTRSLEEILTRVPHQTIYLDPTATIERSSVLVSIAKQARLLLGSTLKGCYFNSEKRNIFFYMGTQDSTKTLNLTAIRQLLEPVILSNTQRLTHPFYYTITISIQKPQGSVVAVDKASVVDRNITMLAKTFVSKLKWPLLIASTTSSLGISASNANMSSSHMNRTNQIDLTLPAVSNINGWIGAAGDYLHNQRGSGGGAIGEAGIAVPLTHDFGAQLHGLDGAAGGANLQSIDGYIFWRNPAQGLLGPHVMYTKSSNFHDTLYGLHGEYYLDNWTLTGELGGASRSPNSNGGYGEAIVNWYAIPDWRVYAGAIDLAGDVTGQIGTEYQLGLSSLPGLAVFADAGAGAHDLNYGFLGLRYYFGDVCNPCKSLERRQREDMVLPTLDPLNVPSISRL